MLKNIVFLTHIEDMEIIYSEESDIELLELQGDVENMDAFDGKFNKDLVQLEFETFVLSGRKVEKEFCILEKATRNDECYLKIVKKVKNVYLFDRPPKYKRVMDSSKSKK